MIKLYMYKRTEKNAPLDIEKLRLSALERTFIKIADLCGKCRLDKERIARKGSYDPESHLWIPYSHVSANKFKTI
jgi:hypothetical protein